MPPEAEVPLRDPPLAIDTPIVISQSVIRTTIIIIIIHITDPILQGVTIHREITINMKQRRKM